MGIISYNTLIESVIGVMNGRAGRPALQFSSILRKQKKKPDRKEIWLRNTKKGEKDKKWKIKLIQLLHSVVTLFQLHRHIIYYGNVFQNIQNLYYQSSHKYNSIDSIQSWH